MSSPLFPPASSVVPVVSERDTTTAAFAIEWHETTSRTVRNLKRNATARHVPDADLQVVAGDAAWQTYRALFEFCAIDLAGTIIDLVDEPHEFGVGGLNSKLI